MICPNCNKSCEDGSTFCPHCEAVLDTSILGDIPDDAGTDDTPIPEAPAPRPKAQPSRGQKPASRPRRRAPIDEAPAEAAVPSEPEPAIPSGGNKYSQYWVDDDPPASKPAEAGRVPVGGGTVQANGFKADTQDPAEIVKQVWASFLALHFEDKVTSISAAALFFGSVMPWRTTPDGDDMGFLTWGFVTLFLAFGAVAAIWARRTGKFNFLPARKLPMLSLGAGGLSALIAAVFAMTAFERGARFGQMVVVAQPASGVFISLLAAAGIIVGSILTSKRER